MRCSSALIATLLLTQHAPAQTVTSVVTTADLSLRMAPQPRRMFSNKAPRAHLDASITVDDKVVFQEMEGFGASITDSAAFLLSQRLDAVARARVMRTLFDPKAGMGLSFLRQPIGSEDLSRHHFTLDDVPKSATDPRLDHFTLPPEQSEELTLVQEARRINPALTVMAAPWSPPAWMKSGGTMNGGQLLEKYEPVYAQYLVRSVRAFRDAGVPVRYLSVQNEPLNDLSMMASTGMPVEQAARFVANDLGPALKKAGLATQIVALDHSWDQVAYASTLLSDPRTAPFIAGTAFHCYQGDVGVQTSVHNSFPSKGVWLSECSGGTWDKEPALIKTARLMIEATRNWAKAVVLWGIALDQNHGPWDGGCDTCRPLVTINTDRTPGVVTYNADLYGLGHAARFVAPGAWRIESSTSGSRALSSVAFLNRNGRTALIVLNSESSGLTFTVKWRGRYFVQRIPPKSLETLTWWRRPGDDQPNGKRPAR